MRCYNTRYILVSGLKASVVSILLLGYCAGSDLRSAERHADDPLTAHTSFDYASGSRSLSAFETLELKTNRIPAGKASRSFRIRIQHEQSEYSQCDSGFSKCHVELRKWRAELPRFRQMNGRALLSAVNTYANRLIQHTDDALVYGENDHWATPGEALSGYGDCEDVAILKYMTLRDVGFSDQDLRIVVVWDSERNLGHAVLTVKVDRRIYILDSLYSEITDDPMVSRYTPLYSWNQSGQWLNIPIRRRVSTVSSLQDQ